MTNYATTRAPIRLTSARLGYMPARHLRSGQTQARDPERRPTANWVSTPMPIEESLRETKGSTYQSVLQKLEDLKGVYQVRDAEQVIAFLQRNLSLLPVLEQAVMPAQQAFGRDTQISLQVEEDPESDTQQLVALIQTDSAPEAAMERLEQFDRAWWLSVVSETLSRLLFYIEHRA